MKLLNVLFINLVVPKGMLILVLSLINSCTTLKYILISQMSTCLLISFDLRNGINYLECYG